MAPKKKTPASERTQRHNNNESSIVLVLGRTYGEFRHLLSSERSYTIPHQRTKVKLFFKLFAAFPGSFVDMAPDGCYNDCMSAVPGGILRAGRRFFMSFDFAFVLNSVLFGVGLAMDAFSVSAANALSAPHMPAWERFRIAGTFALFQIAMPLVGWFCVRTVAERFVAFQRFIPWIALLLLLYIGGGMLREGLKGEERQAEEQTLSHAALLMQGLATSIDALSVGFTIADLGFAWALGESLIIGAVTLLICLFGLFLGRKVGEKLRRAAPIVGGVILIAIGVRIFLGGVL